MFVNILVLLFVNRNVTVTLKDRRKKSMQMLTCYLDDLVNVLKCYLFKTYCSNLECAPLLYNFTLTAMKKI